MLTSTFPETSSSAPRAREIDPLGVFKGKVSMPFLAGIAAIGISKTTAYRLVREKHLDLRKIGKGSFLTVASLLHIVEHGVPPPAATPSRQRAGLFVRPAGRKDPH